MSRTVYDNSMVAHVWANQSQESARSHNGNFHFAGSIIYSYQTPIARLWVTVDGRRVALVDSASYSMTTSSKHMPAIWRALARTVPAFMVPHPASERHPDNLAYLAARYAELRASLHRRRDLWRPAAESLQELANGAIQYAEAFGLAVPAFDVDGDAATITAAHAARQARNADPAYQAKREREKERREARKIEREREATAQRHRLQEESRSRWLAGEYVGYAYQLASAGGGALLRVRSDNVETSRGANVPLSHAVKAFRFIKLCRERGQEWRRNGHSIHVGHFTVDHIEANGNFRAGCHFIEWSEVERIARQIGVIDDAASAEALQETAHA